MPLASLELNWIRREDKTLPLPRVVFHPLDGMGGFYHFPEPAEVLIGETHYDATKGLIVVSTETEHPASIIAHEWRHHWQTFHGWTYDGIDWPEVETDDEYWPNVARYFAASKSELDALLFEHRKAPDWISERWCSMLPASLVSAWRK